MSHITVEIKVFLYFFGLLMEGSGFVKIITDPDREHCFHWLPCHQMFAVTTTFALGTRGVRYIVESIQDQYSAKLALQDSDLVLFSDKIRYGYTYQFENHR
jgi:hypothetical protein